jgi:hypothetical protein
VFGASAASGISTSNITNWNNKLDSEVDGSKTNELQTLSISGNNLSISSKNTVELPFLSEIPDNSVTTAKILNGTIVNEDIGSSAAISSSKINGMPGVEYTGNSSYSALPTTNTDIGSISVSCPTSGYVFIVARANPIIFGDGTRVVFGLGTSSTSQNLDEVHIGHIDGAGTDRRYYSATVMATVNVNAGTNTFYFSAYKSSFGTPDAVNLSNIRMQAIFVPFKY